MNLGIGYLGRKRWGSYLTPTYALPTRRKHRLRRWSNQKWRLRLGSVPEMPKPVDNDNR